MIYYVDSLTGQVAKLIDNTYDFYSVHTSFQNLILIPSRSPNQFNIYDINTNQLKNKITLSTNVSTYQVKNNQDLIILNNLQNIWVYKISSGQLVIGYSSQEIRGFEVNAPRTLIIQLV